MWPFDLFKTKKSEEERSAIPPPPPPAPPQASPPPDFDEYCERPTNVHRIMMTAVRSHHSDVPDMIESLKGIRKEADALNTADLIRRSSSPPPPKKESALG